MAFADRVRSGLAWGRAPRPGWAWILALLLGAVRLVPAWWAPLDGKIDPDVGHYSRGAKHWALSETFAREDDFATEFVTPVHAWITAGLFRAFGPSYENAIRLAQVEMILVLGIVAWAVARRPFLGAALCLLFFWSDPAVKLCVSSGGAEPTQMIGVSAAILLAVTAGDRRGLWAASGFFFSWALLAKPTAAVLVPAFALFLFSGGFVAGLARAAWFASGALPLAAAAGLFLSRHWGMAQRAWEATLLQAGDHDRAPWVAVGVSLFHWGNLGWRHTLAPLYLLAVPACAAVVLTRRPGWVPEDRLRRFWWLAVLGYAALLFFPPTGRRYVLIALPLAYLAARALAEPALWEEGRVWLESSWGRRFLWAWLIAASMPVFSYLKEPLSIWLGHRTGRESGWTQAVSGFCLLAAAGGGVSGAVFGMRPLAHEPSASLRLLLVGSGGLLANFFLVRLHGIGSSLLGDVRHTPKFLEAPLGFESVQRAAVVSSMSWAVGILAVGLAWRLLAAGRARPAGSFFAGLAALFAVGGLGVPLLRDLRTEKPPGSLGQVARELKLRIPEGATVYGGRYADAALLGVRCRVVTPWAWYGGDVDVFIRSTAKYRWNLPIARFKPDFLLLEDEGEKEDPNVRKVWAPWLAGLDRGAGPIWEGTLDKHKLRLYALRWEKK